MKSRIIKHTALAVALIMSDYYAGGQQVKSGGAWEILPVKNGNVMANIRGKGIASNDINQHLAFMLGLSDKYTFKQVTTSKDQLGITHAGYEQYYQGIKVDGAKILVHAKDGLVNNINGKVAQLGNLSVQPVLKENEAYTAAKNATEIAKLFKTNYPVELVVAALPFKMSKQYNLAYKVRFDGKAKDGKLIMVNVFVDAVSGKVLNSVNLMVDVDKIGTANTLYNGVKSFTVDSVAAGFRLRDNGRKIETYNGAGAAYDSVSQLITNKDYYNNTGNFNLFNTLSSSVLSSASSNMLNGVGVTNEIRYALAEGLPATGVSLPYSPFTKVYVFAQTSLPDTILGLYNILDPAVSYTGMYMNGQPTASGDFQIADTAYYPVSNTTLGNHAWNDAQGNSGSYTISMEKNPAVDAHWGMQKTHDFYKNVFNRNSFDNQGSVIRNYVNYVNQYNAAAAPAPYNFMVYGLGDSRFMNPLVSIDILGHEFTHMVTEHNGNGGLNYQGESGALNESFSDIMGTCIEFYAKGQDGNWLIGEDVSIQSPGFLRSMAAPKLAQNPDTYEGQYWQDPTNVAVDAGGVHYNSGVQNKWFYLLSVGGSGTNDKGNTYTVPGIGIEKASEIAYRNLTTYLVPQSNYLDASEGSLQAAIDLYGGETSPEYKAVKEAWYAVGIGEKPTTAVNEIAVTNNDLKLYPNPATGKVTIASKLNEKLDAQILNVAGVPVMNITIAKGFNVINISALTKGVYMIRYNTGAKGFVQKLSVL